MLKIAKYAAVAVLASFSCHAAPQQDVIEAERLYDRFEQHDTTALDALEALALDEDAHAMVVLGFIHEYGVSVPRDVRKAIQYYERACGFHGDLGCANAAYFFEFGIGVPQDRGEAQRYLERIDIQDLEGADNFEAMRRLVYKGKADAETDVDMRLPLIEYLGRHVGSAMSSDRRAMSRMGFTKLDTLRLARLWAQRDQNPTMLFMVGHFYNVGYSSVEKKDIEAFKWFRRAAEAGEPQSQNLLGVAYEKGGWGILSNPELALVWYGRSAKQNDLDALINLGKVFYLGEIVPVDYSRALSLFKRAFDKSGSESAAKYLSWIYYNGQSVKTNCRLSLRYRRLLQSRLLLDRLDDSTFWQQCKSDQLARRHAAQTLPAMTLSHKSTFLGGNDGALACEPHFVVTTNKLGEIANLRVSVELTNNKGATLQRTLAFSPFGLNTANEDLQGRERDALSSNTLVPMETSDFCQFEANFKVKAATATVSGREMDLLAEGMLKRADR